MKLSKNELNKMVEVVERTGIYNGLLYSSLTNRGSYTKSYFQDIKDFDFEGLKGEEVSLFHPEEINTFKRLNKPLLKSEETLQVETEIEGDLVILEAKFNLQGHSIKYQIFGKRHFRKPSKKSEMNRFYETFEVIVKNHQKLLDARMERIKDKFRVISNIRQTLAILASEDNDNLTKEEILNVIDLYLGYLTSSDKKQFLQDNNFKGIENLNINNRKSDGFGHEIVTYSAIDFIRKEVRVNVGCSCD